jgi:uncharacterized coiled-coil DUF342 family protein
MDEEKLMKLKEKVDFIKTELAIKESKRDDLLKQAKENYGIETFAAIGERLDEIEKSLKTLKKRKEILTEKIEEKLDAYES